MICIYRCKNCGGRMKYSIEKQKLTCSSCGSFYGVDQINTDNITYEGKLISEGEMEMVECPSCGAQATLKQGSAKVKCSYCDTEMSVFGLREDTRLPEKIIPFTLSKDDAKGKFISWWLGHDVMPKLNYDKLNITIKDLYVPVWLINADVLSSMSVNYSPYVPYSEIPLKDRDIKRAYSSKFANVPFDASVHIEDEQFYNIEPFQYGAMRDFNPTYLSGHMAECYHNSVEITVPRAVGRMKKMALKETKELIDLDIRGGVINYEINSEAYIIPDNITYVLVPVWVVKYEYEGQRHYVYVNGQTGKVDGKVLFEKNKTNNKLYAYSISMIAACIFGGLIVGNILSFLGLTFNIICGDFTDPSIISKENLLVTICFLVGVFILYSFIFKDYLSTKESERFKLSETEKLRLKHHEKLKNINYVFINSLTAFILGSIYFVSEGMIFDNAVMNLNFNTLFAELAAMVFAVLSISRYRLLFTEKEQFILKTDYLDYIDFYDVKEIPK